MIALVALGVAVYAIQRDRANLRVRYLEPAAGSQYASVVNIGLRAVRLEELVLEGGLAPGAQRGPIVNKASLPVILEPGHEFLLQVPNAANYGRTGRDARWVVVDASGRRYRVR